MHIPRFIISGLSGGAGKTMLSLGLARFFARSGLSVRAFKKGPDYIDAAWLAKAARSPQANLDPYFTPGQKLLDLFIQGAQGYDLALAEGNRGLFDGLDLQGTCSTAEVSRILKAPVILILDCTKMTRTVAAVVKGCLSFEEGLHVGGVILNRTGNERHQTMVRRAVEELAGCAVLGVLPRRAEPFIFERHMGLAGMDELAEANERLEAIADFIQEHVDTRKVLEIARAARALPQPASRPEKNALAMPPARPSGKPRIGYVHDAALWFYYRENLDALEQAGAELLPVSLLETKPWPELDGLYLGGGLPELHAEALGRNSAIRDHVAALSRSGMPIYAECGGFMYLAQSLELAGGSCPMAGVFPFSVRFHPRPRGLGYVEAQVLADTPFHPAGACLRGHEFHFSGISGTAAGDNALCPPGLIPALLLGKGKGMFSDALGNRFDGVLSRNTFAAYTHIYAPAVPYWAPRFTSLCRKFALRGKNI